MTIKNTIPYTIKCLVFAAYDGINLQLTKRYEGKLKGDKKWVSAFESKNSLHEETYRELKPLVDKKRGGGDLTDIDRKLLKEIDKQIFESLIK